MTLSDTIARRYILLAEQQRVIRQEKLALADAIASHGGGETTSYLVVVKYLKRNHCVGRDALIQEMGKEKAEKFIKSSTVRLISVIPKNKPSKKSKKRKKKVH